MNEKSSLTWHKFMEGSLPPEDIDVLAYSKKWIDTDCNPRGIRIGFRDEDRFYSAQWDMDSDYYSTHCSDDNEYYDYIGEDELPEYWTEIPELNI